MSSSIHMKVICFILFQHQRFVFSSLIILQLIIIQFTGLQKLSIETINISFFFSGRSVDITLSEVNLNGHITELDRSSCGHWGGSCVDKAFKSALAEIFTEEMIKNYKHRHLADYIYLFREFEKRKFISRQNSFIMKFPFSLYEECLKTFGEDLITHINKSKFKDQIIMKLDKLKMNWKLFETFFQPACDGIIKHVKKLFHSPKFKDVNKIFMVGGFSESYILQDAIRDAFPNCHVIVPKEPSLAVLRGAVMLGNDLQSIASRIS